MDAPPPLTDRPKFPAEMAVVRRELEALFTSTPMYETLGVSLDAWGPGWARVSMVTTPSMGNLAGSVHGGATFTLADAAFEIACNAYGRLAVALETTCHYHRPGQVGETIRADAWEVARGGRTASYRLQVSDDSGTILTSYLALAYRTSRWHIDPEAVPESWR